MRTSAGGTANLSAGKISRVADEGGGRRRGRGIVEERHGLVQGVGNKPRFCSTRQLEVRPRAEKSHSWSAEQPAAEGRDGGERPSL